MIPVADPFMADAPVRRPGDFYRTVKGVPLVADPNGKMTKPKNKKDPGHVKRIMYRRPSGFGKQIENTYNLQKWGERQQALGFALDFNILKRATALLDGDRDSKEWKDEADSVVVAAKNAAKAWIAADRGTHTHGLAEDDDTGTDVDIISRIDHGETLGLDRKVQQALVDGWRAMLECNGLEIVAVEFACVNDHYKAAGTGDRVARLTKSLRFRLITGELVELAAGTYVILDIKTGQYRRHNNGVAMYWQSHAVQVALYAPPGACLYDPDTDERTPFPWPISEDWALIAHLDVLGALDGNPSCELVLVDLTAGRRAADLCVAAREWENEATVFSVAQIVEAGDLGPVNPSASTPDVEGVRGPVPRPALERILARVVATPGPLATDCWISTFAKDPDGYTSIRVDGRHGTRPQAHRVTYEALVGEIPDGLPLDHLCRVPSCVNPAHLEPVTPAENSRRSRAARNLEAGDTVSPQATQSPAAVNAGEAGSIGPTRPPATTEGITMTPREALLWASQPAPAPLPALPANPDEGKGVDWGWESLKEAYDLLPATDRAWISRLVSEAQHANVGFHSQGHHTARRALIIEGLITLANHETADDDVLRALVTAALHNDAPLDQRHTAGACVGSLGAAAAQRFATLVDDYVGTSV